MRLTSVLCIAFPLLLMAGCRGDDGGPDPATPDASQPPPPDAAPAAEYTVQEVQDEAMAAGTPVILRGVVVVAVDGFGQRQGNVYVMEPDGGPFSGVAVNVPNAQGAVPGDLVDVEGGIKAEFALDADTSTRTLTQIEAPQGGQVTITKVGDGTIPAPEVLDPSALAADDAEAEKWEGVLVQFEDVAIGTPARSIDFDDPTLVELEITGPFRIDSSLTEIDGAAITYGDCYQSITGIGQYFFEYKIMPRSTDDLVGGGTGCAQEIGADCSDTNDNDADGHADCFDLECQDAVAECALTVIDVQNDTYGEGQWVKIKGAVVAAVESDRKDLYIQDLGVTDDHNGLYVFRGAQGELDAQIVVGARVDVFGRVGRYFGSTNLDNVVEVSFAAAGDPNDVVVRTDVDAFALRAASTASPYEGVVVEFQNLPVFNAAYDNFGRFSVGSAGMELVIDPDQIDADFDPTVTASDCFATVRGIVVLNTFDDYYMLAPRSADDLVTGGTCP
ncbi:hypothetical protein [Haliangium sp.]|uniref:hypothetical protein n=1 Tax=Haliangium sp. TaxID=2663208 RepID=UPI003D12E526